MITTDIELFYQSFSKGKALLAIDHGLKKIGLAISSPELTMALPLKTINIDKMPLHKLVEEINLLIKARSIGAIVIGLPLSLDGTENEQSRLVCKFASAIAKACSLAIFLQDERYSSKEADNLLKSTGMKRRERNSVDDAVAASLILETTLRSIQRLKSLP